MTYEEKRIERLRWCMRYIMCHPDNSPKFYQEEFKFDPVFSIEVASRIFAEAVCNLDCDKEGKFEELEEIIFNEILKLK